MFTRVIYYSDFNCCPPSLSPLEFMTVTCALSTIRSCKAWLDLTVNDMQFWNLCKQLWNEVVWNIINERPNIYFIFSILMTSNKQLGKILNLWFAFLDVKPGIVI